jgi:hypothetical protein
LAAFEARFGIGPTPLEVVDEYIVRAVSLAHPNKLEDLNALDERHKVLVEYDVIAPVRFTLSMPARDAKARHPNRSSFSK